MVAEPLRISLVVPVFNEQELLLENNPFHAWQEMVDEIVIVDGSSEDETRSILQDMQIPYMTSPGGRARQMNMGATQAMGDVLWFVHADSQWDASHVQDIRMVMQDVSVVGGRFDVRLSGNHPMFPLISHLMNVRSRLTGIATGDQCMFVRKKAFDAMGGFPDQMLMEDIALSKHLKRMGRVACLRRKVTTSSRRWEKYGVFRTIGLMWALRFLYGVGVSPEKLAAIYLQGHSQKS